jgi:hypothetical protein
VSKEDQHQFALNAEKGAKHDDSLITRMANNVPAAIVNLPNSQ